MRTAIAYIYAAKRIAFIKVEHLRAARVLLALLCGRRPPHASHLSGTPETASASLCGQRKPTATTGHTRASARAIGSGCHGTVHCRAARALGCARTRTTRAQAGPMRASARPTSHSCSSAAPRAATYARDLRLSPQHGVLEARPLIDLVGHVCTATLQLCRKPEASDGPGTAPTYACARSSEDGPDA